MFQSHFDAEVQRRLAWERSIDLQLENLERFGTRSQPKLLSTAFLKIAATQPATLPPILLPLQRKRKQQQPIDLTICEDEDEPTVN